jgi:hypothetical protein
MLIFQRALRTLVSRQSWLLPIVVAITVFLTSWALLALVDFGNSTGVDLPNEARGAVPNIMAGTSSTGW